MLNRRCLWNKSQVPHDHDKGSNERNCKSKESARSATELSDQHVADHPREVAVGEICRTDQQRDQEELRTEGIRVVVMTERESRSGCWCFTGVAHHQTDDNECHDAGPALTDGSVNEGKCNGDQQHHGNWDAETE
jgi:hypothetical protein